MKLRFTPRAVDDLTILADRLNERSPSGARNVRMAIDGCLQALMMFPQSGRLQNVDNIRKAVTRRYRYLIYYMLDESHDELVILNVKHPAELPEYEELPGDT